MPLTRDQAQQLASLACAARPHGAPQWDAPGVIAALGKVKHLHLADVALALFRAADDREIRTPAVLGNPRSACWQERATGRTGERDNPPPQERCSVCSLSRERCEAIRFADDDHTFEPAALDRKRDPDTIRQIVEATKAEVELTKAPVEPTPVPVDPNVEALRGVLSAPDTHHTTQETP